MVTKVDDKEIEKQLDYMHKISERVHGLKYSINTMGCKLNENDSEKIAELTKKLEDQEKSWNERYQKTFFNGTGEPHDHENEITDQVDDQSGDDDGSELATTYDELFG